MSDSNDIPTDNKAATGTSTGLPRWLMWTLGVALALVIIVPAAIYVDANYTNFVLGGGEDALDQDDLDAALSRGETAETVAPTDETGEVDTPVEPTVTTAPSTDAPADTAAPTTEVFADSGDQATAGTGTWTVTDASELGYRVTEVLFGVDTEGVGRTNQVDGALTIDGTQVTDAEFVVDVASIESDDGRRDNQFRGRIMSTDEFPTATFTLTEPIELGTESDDGATVETTATGDLTLRGVTNPVTFDVSAQQSDGRIGVLGNIPVVFADYEISNPSVPGITTEDNGLLEFVLVFEPAG